MRRVLVAAAHIDLVNGVIDAAEKGGLTVEGVDLISSALVRVVGSQGASDQPEAIVSIGAGLTVVVVHQQGRPQFVRTIGSGGNATTAAVSAALGIPIADAEGVKRRIGEPIAQMQTAERASQASITELVNEIKNSIQYFASLPGRLPVSRVFVTGGGSNLHGLIPMLESEVRLPVLTVAPLDRVDTSKLDLSAEQAAQVGPVLATPIGLGLPEPDKAVKKFNLLPPEVANRIRMKRIQERTVVGAVAVLIVLLGFGGWKLYNVHKTQNQVAVLQANIASLNAQVPKFDLVVAANDAYSAGVNRRASVLSQAVDWPLALSNLISITPAGAKVDSFDGQTLVATPAAGSSGSSTSSAGSASTGAATSTTSAAIGTIQLGVTGPGPSLTISEAWINAIAGSQLFANPIQGSTTATGNTIAFPFTISITPNASLNKNASLK
jgi:type IV pilus assembly protein PilM